MSPTLEKMFLKHLRDRGKPLELSCFYFELDTEPMETLEVLHDLGRRGEVWWLNVSEEHAIVGLPEQLKPEDPAAYLGLIEQRVAWDDETGHHEAAYFIPAQMIQRGS